jgi:hypothetical protein
MIIRDQFGYLHEVPNRQFVGLGESPRGVAVYDGFGSPVGAFPALAALIPAIASALPALFSRRRLHRQRSHCPLRLRQSRPCQSRRRFLRLRHRWSSSANPLRHRHDFFRHLGRLSRGSYIAADVRAAACRCVYE